MEKRVVVRDSHCSDCGAAYADTATYPRVCPACGKQTWANPIPVGVALVPLSTTDGPGVLMVRRGIEPGKGKLALVGGFLEAHETWAAGSSREVREETAVLVDPATLTPFWFASSAPGPNRVLLFGLAPAQASSALPAFVSNAETLERGLVFGPGGLEDVCAFPLHVEALRRYFAAYGVDGAHRWRAI